MEKYVTGNNPDSVSDILPLASFLLGIYQTARTDLLELEKRGFLIKRQRGREFLFIFNEKSDLWKKKN